ncbi:TetR/AcrR family transcriptional regulator [Mycetocola zhadangensis]|uniref:TetR/AcrR family transcriptional regulator n=1 Tax=Mycetocola zhadangensis TaxID=1164595 RepID=A0A3L7J7L1_9MICO|nr:TetR/AcrR family transcriptional regulator [Mycetocola zhadangensis]RLQ84492.1 TetR/AcrR family transcriptional regulator [Mycetocola zhadangensis]GGE92497.1 putative TetR-family regulatory protein [Mycetocola zhadangensis]
MSTSVEQLESQGDSARRRKTRDRLIDAAYEVFAETGIHAASVEMITERAGFTRGAFYSNFDTKEELFFALAERENRLRFERLQDGVDSILPGLDATSAVTDETLSSLVMQFLEMQGDDRRWCLVQSEFRLLAMRDATVAASYLEYQRNFQGELAARLEDALRSVGLSFVIDPVAVTRMIVNVYESAMQESILEGSNVPNMSRSPIVLGTLPPLIQSLTRPL